MRRVWDVLYDKRMTHINDFKGKIACDWSGSTVYKRCQTR